MAGWEIALIIVAVTFLMVNTVQVIINLKMMVKMDSLLSKSVGLYEKLLGFGDKMLSELIEEISEDEE